MMLCRITKVKVRSPDLDTGFFDNVAGVLLGDALPINMIMTYYSDEHNSGHLEYVLSKNHPLS